MFERSFGRRDEIICSPLSHSNINDCVLMTHNYLSGVTWREARVAVVLLHVPDDNNKKKLLRANTAIQALTRTSNGG